METKRKERIHYVYEAICASQYSPWCNGRTDDFRLFSKELLPYVLPSLEFFLEPLNPELTNGMSIAHDPSRNIPIGMFLISSVVCTFSNFCARTAFPEFDSVPGIETSMGK